MTLLYYFEFFLEISAERLIVYHFFFVVVDSCVQQSFQLPTLS